MKVAGGAVTATGAAPPATGVSRGRRQRRHVDSCGCQAANREARLAAARHAGLGRACGYSGA